MSEQISVTADVLYKDASLKGLYQLVSVSSMDTVVIKHPTHGNLKIATKYTNLPTYEALTKDIRESFTVLDRLTQGVIAGNIRALIVSGAPGVGKTHSIERDLKKARTEGKIRRYMKINTAASAIGLYMMLWQHRHDDDVIMIDDCDNIFDDLDAINLLKAALDTGKTRTITYVKASKELMAQGIPNHFEYSGRIVFISNIDFDKTIESNSKLAPHLSALLDRSLYLSLGIHSTRALLARVEMVCRETDMLKDLKLTDEDIETVIQWIKDNFPKLRSLSLRTALMIAEQMRTDPTDWRETVKRTVLRPVKR